MNASQRKFLIEKIQNTTRKRIQELTDSKKKYPSVSNYLFKAILQDQLELESEEHILAALKRKALAGTEDKNWLSNQYMGYEKYSTVTLQVSDLIVLPEDYKKELDNVREFNKSIDEEITLLKAQLNTVEMRVQLASDNVLQKLINEVDDMGDLSLIDTKIKLLN